MCDGILCCLLLSCLLRAISFPFILKLHLKGEKSFVFYVFMLRNFIVFNNNLEEILFHSAYVRVSETESESSFGGNN